MKRIIALVLSLTMILALCACGETEAKLAVGETASTDIAQSLWRMPNLHTI